MLTLPRADPGTPDLRSSRRYLQWVIVSQGWRLVAAVAAGIVWMVAQALVPAVVGIAIDRGVTGRDTSALVGWASVLLGLGLVQAAAGVVRHRFSVSMWLDAAYRTVQLVNDQAARLGATLRRRVTTGEVVSVGASDIANIGNSVDVLGRAAGGAVAFVVVAGLLLSVSTTLGLVVLVGAPLLLLALGPLLSPLQRRNAHARELASGLNNRGADIVTGLRVLRGIGGEQVFARRYRTESQTVRAAGVHVGRLQSVLDALQVLLPGIFVVVVVWLGARLALEGRISSGELVAFYGYATFLMLPLRTATELATKLVRANVASARIVDILALEHDLPDPADPEAEPSDTTLVDPASGLVVEPGTLLALVDADAAAAARLADRLAMFSPGDVTLGGVRLDALPRDVVRRRVVVSATDAMMFGGRLRDQLDLTGEAPDERLADVLAATSAADVLLAAPDGLETDVDERGRSFSGGQRQRLVLARALLHDPDVLVLVEPTSAVDAHTEDRIAARLRDVRAGRSTVVVTTSPLLLDRVDEVAFVVDGVVAARGPHASLLERVPAYRAVVSRDTGADETDVPVGSGTGVTR